MVHLLQTLSAVLAVGMCSGTPETSSTSGPADARLTVSHYRVPCTGVSLQLCLLVRWDGGDEAFFYDDIEGFDYEWGYTYDLEVAEITHAAPPADGSSISYRMTRLVKKEKVSPDLSFELPLNLNGRSLIEPEGDQCMYLGGIPVWTENQPCESLSQSDVGVFQHRGAGLLLVETRN